MKRIRQAGSRIRGWWLRAWGDIRPGPEAGQGAIWALRALVLWAIVVGGVNLVSGFGTWIDLAFASVIALAGIPLLVVIVALLLTIFRSLPRRLFGILFGVSMFVALLWPPPLGPLMGIILALVEGVFGATVATMLAPHFRKAALSKRIITVALCVLAVAANVGLYTFLSSDGTNDQIIRLQPASPLPAKLPAPNPAERGPYQVKMLFYGNGTDIRRPEFGKTVAIKTATVDASAFFPDFKGWKANIRKQYWGFGMDKLPLNGRVWYPDGAGPFPLALIVHGNHDMAEFSDPGYQYLGELLASRGFILASVDENFLNSGLFHDPPKQQAVRGWMLLEHLRMWREWNNTRANPFYKKIDVENVALMGHSRGGEAAATAALFNKLAYYPDDATIRFHYGFPIQSIVAIAPADGQYKPAGQWRTIENVNYLTLQGANDADVSTFDGSRQWDRVRFTEAGPWFKSELYVYRANHGQFNTVWGRSDTGAPLDWFLNLKPLMSGEDQRRISKTYISAFLEATLHHRHEYIPLFQDYRTIRDWVPNTLYVNRYLDASYQLVSNFNEDPDVTTTTVPGGQIRGENLSIWKEGRIPFRRGDRDYNGVFLGWNREADKKKSVPPVAVYSISLPDDLPRAWKLGAQSVLTLSLAVTEDKAPPPGRKIDDKSKEADKDEKKKPELVDFTVELQSSDGVAARLPLSRFGALLPPLKVRFTKLARMDDVAYKKASEPAFQTFELPLAAFTGQNQGFDPSKLKTIRLRFDRTPMAVVILSQIGFAVGGPVTASDR